MGLKSGLTLWAYTPTNPSIAVPYQAELESLSFSTFAPGGFGTLNATIKLDDPRPLRPELALFSRVVLVGKGKRVFLGEIYNAPLSGNETADSVTIQAQGYGAALRDNPQQAAYSGQTVRQIAINQLAGLANWATPLSQDPSGLFPDNPATVMSPTYDGRNAEEILLDVAALAGDYMVVTWDHPTALDGSTFPTGQVQVHLRDTTTIGWQAIVGGLAEIIVYDIAKSADRAYNLIEIRYNDSSASGSGPASAYAVDSRLAYHLSGGVPVIDGQGTAPNRPRRFMRDLSGVATITAAVAQVIANTYLAQMKDPPSKMQATLAAVRDANGNVAELWEVRADSTLYVPDLPVRGAQLAMKAMPGVNQFYLLQTNYTEGTQDARLAVVGDNYYDSAAAIVSRMQLIADRAARGADRTTGGVWQLGAPYHGWASNGGASVAGAGIIVGLQGTSFSEPLARAPTSISWAATAFSTNCGGASANTFSQYGFNAWVVSTGAGVVNFGAQFTTVGNCIRRVDPERGTLDWHCDGCGAEHLDVPLAGAGPSASGARLESGPADNASGDAPGQSHLAIRCPCGAGESFNTALLAEDEDGAVPGNFQHRAEQARLIRAAMADPLVGLRQA